MSEKQDPRELNALLGLEDTLSRIALPLGATQPSAREVLATESNPVASHAARASSPAGAGATSQAPAGGTAAASHVATEVKTTPIAMPAAPALPAIVHAHYTLDAAALETRLSAPPSVNAHSFGLVQHSTPALAPAAAPEGSATVQTTTSDTPTSPSMADEVTFISGVNTSGPNQGQVAAVAFQTWNGDNPPTYDSQLSYASKWGSSETPGTSGGTETYYFDPSSNWTPTEMTGFKEGLALWSAESNIKFVQTTDGADPDLTIIRGSDGGSYETEVAGSYGDVGTTTLGNQGRGVYISIDTTVSGWQNLGSFTASGGYDMETIVHEEGHFLGLGHSGPYDGDVNSSVQQYSAFDNRQYSLMSYIYPTDTSAKYYNSSTTTQWNGNVSTTPQMLDILAAQQLYGVPTNTPLSGSNIFGFHTNIDPSISAFFDFTVNTSPVVTLFDTGTNNTLDLSLWSTPETVDLMPGTFSSADGMVNNIGIAYGTQIDTFLGGTGGTNVTVNADADFIKDLGSSNNSVDFAGNLSNYSLTRSGSDVFVMNHATGIVDTLFDVQTLVFADQSVQTSDVACYVAGTLIETARGPIAVEHLVAGDEVQTFSGVLRPIKWIGHRSYNAQALAASPELLPVHFEAHALGAGLPRRSLWVSPKHAMLLDGALIPAECLVNGRTILRETGLRSVQYFHVELESHDILLAEGAPSESFVDDYSRGMFHNALDYAVLFPGEAAQPARFCAPRVEDGYELELIRSRLALHYRQGSTPLPY